VLALVGLAACGLLACGTDAPGAEPPATDLPARAGDAPAEPPAVMRLDGDGGAALDCTVATTLGCPCQDGATSACSVNGLPGKQACVTSGAGELARSTWGSCVTLQPKTITFTSNGTWTCPPAVTTVWLSATGGGGAGGGFGTGAGYHAGGGGGGGAAAVDKQETTVTAGADYAIVIGQGGGHTNYQIGLGGTPTSFGSLLTLAGGDGADNVFSGGGGAAGGPGGQAGEHGGANGGKGGDTLFGIGGSGAAGGEVGGGFGSGGGGTTYDVAGGGGDGAPGFVRIDWLE
jgi:hypothetical protein